MLKKETAPNKLLTQNSKWMLYSLAVNAYSL